jgi:anti-sigma factor RsiW
MDDCAEIRTELGVYILGAITPARRAAVTWHLASCQQCREEVAGLAALPGLLRRLPAEMVEEPASRVGQAADADPASVPPGDMITRIIRRRRRERCAVIAAAVARLAAGRGRHSGRRCDGPGRGRRMRW